MNRKNIVPIENLITIKERSFYLVLLLLSIAVAFNIASGYKFWTSIPAVTYCSNPLAVVVQDILGEKKNESGLASKIATRFDIEETRAKEIIAFSHAYGAKTFPTYKDILAIIAIESSFNKEAENLGAYGLMQIQFAQHKEKSISLAFLRDPLSNIAVGSQILKDYYQQLGSIEAAVLAYQAGVGGYLKGEISKPYLEKFLLMKSWLISVT